MTEARPPISARFPHPPYKQQFIDEPMTDIFRFSLGSIKIKPAYYEQGLDKAVPECYLRIGAAERLMKAKELLPQGLTFLIFDAWRPISVQKALFDKYYSRVKAEFPNLSDSELAAKASFFVSPPSYDRAMPSVHNTGGAVDLTVIEESTGQPLYMGTEFDDFTERSHTAFFENDPDSIVCRNRRLLYSCMTAAGFTNLPTEWWHFDFGTNFWSFYSGKPALYCGLLDEIKNGGQLN